MKPSSSQLSSVRRYAVCIMLLATPLVLASSAYADLLSIGLQETGVNSGNVTTVASGAGAVGVGPIVYGSFSLNLVTASDFAVLGAPSLLDSNAQDASTATAGVLNIWVTAQGIPGSVLTHFLSTFAVNDLSGTVANVTLQTYFSPTNSLYNAPGTVLLSAASFTAAGTAGPLSASGSPTILYSVTEHYQIFDVGGAVGNDNLTIDLAGTGTTVPEPASLVLFGAGLLGIALKLRR